jgi:hypothetical protein
LPHSGKTVGVKAFGFSNRLSAMLRKAKALLF